MLQISAELLAMSGDAAVLTKNGKIVFANAAANALLGEDINGKSLGAVLGAELAEVQAGSFIGDFEIKGKHYIVRVRSAEGVKAVFLSPPVVDSLLVSDAFLYNIRESLMSINVSMDLLHSRETLDQASRHHLEIISHEFYKLKRTLSNLSLIRSVNENTVFFSPLPIDLASLVKRMGKAVQDFFPDITVSINVPPELIIYGHAELIDCLLMNLISSITHAEGCTHISLNLMQSKNSAFISVDDNGKGISPEAMPAVFERFRHRYDSATVSRGPGLGMTAARLIAALHHGTLLMESRPGIGTAVRVSLCCSPIAGTVLKSPDEAPLLSTRTLLTGFANCLPSKYFGEIYAD